MSRSRCNACKVESAPPMALCSLSRSRCIACKFASASPLAARS
eukprot:CAMPEP_0198572154 /NCGR_PEP_ID=MMETSP1462-20131121/111458_1 /TAXON_ID=1333877 /ORGANISM="Brandtodinium nutriculum, Strain RCC3387" /LENGTH=42 /DNA_ID= /DNA_START= /DNA_END= /DNA_ORIENTATION=